MTTPNDRNRNGILLLGLAAAVGGAILLTRRTQAAPQEGPIIVPSTAANQPVIT
jgi:hypothetical protein